LTRSKYFFLFFLCYLFSLVFVDLLRISLPEMAAFFLLPSPIQPAPMLPTVQTMRDSKGRDLFFQSINTLSPGSSRVQQESPSRHIRRTSRPRPLFHFALPFSKAPLRGSELSPPKTRFLPYAPSLSGASLPPPQVGPFRDSFPRFDIDFTFASSRVALCFSFTPLRGFSLPSTNSLLSCYFSELVRPQILFINRVVLPHGLSSL